MLYDSPYHADSILAIGAQFVDGENANLVQEGNSDALEDNEENDAQRGREDEKEEERNVRPRRGST